MQVDDKGKVNADNWVSGMSFLKANNMNSSNAAVVGGMVFSGAIGENSTVQASAMDSLNVGSETKFNRQTKSLGSMYNSMKDNENKLSMNDDGSINYKKSSKEALSGFANFAANSNLAKNTKDNFLNDFVAKVADETGAPQEAVWATMGIVGGAALNKTVGDPLKKAWNSTKKKLPYSQDSMPNKSSDISGNYQSSQSDKTHKNQSSHIMTPEENLKYSKDQINQSRASIKDYNEELKKEQEKPKPSPRRFS